MNEIRKAIAAIRRQLAKARYTIISIRYQFADEDDETTLEYGGDGSEEGRLKAAEEFLEQVGLSENETVSEVVREVARQAGWFVLEKDEETGEYKVVSKNRDLELSDEEIKELVKEGLISLDIDEEIDYGDRPSDELDEPIFKK